MTMKHSRSSPDYHHQSKNCIERDSAFDDNAGHQTEANNREERRSSSISTSSSGHNHRARRDRLLHNNLLSPLLDRRQYDNAVRPSPPRSLSPSVIRCRRRSLSYSRSQSISPEAEVPSSKRALTIVDRTPRERSPSLFTHQPSMTDNNFWQPSWRKTPSDNNLRHDDKDNDCDGLTRRRPDTTDYNSNYENDCVSGTDSDDGELMSEDDRQRWFKYFTKMYLNNQQHAHGYNRSEIDYNYNSLSSPMSRMNGLSADGNGIRRTALLPTPPPGSEIPTSDAPMPFFSMFDSKTSVPSPSHWSNYSTNDVRSIKGFTSSLLSAARSAGLSTGLLGNGPHTGQHESILARKKLKSQFCRKCNEPFFTSLQEHRHSLEHKHKERTVQRGCLLCKTGSLRTYKAYLGHMDGEYHKQKKKELDDEVNKRKKKKLLASKSPQRHVTDDNNKAAVSASVPTEDMNLNSNQQGSLCLDDVIIVDAMDFDDSASFLRAASNAEDLTKDNNTVNVAADNVDQSNINSVESIDSKDYVQLITTSRDIKKKLASLCARAYPVKVSVKRTTTNRGVRYRLKLEKAKRPLVRRGHLKTRMRCDQPEYSKLAGEHEPFQSKQLQRVSTANVQECDGEPTETIGPTANGATKQSKVLTDDMKSSSRVTTDENNSLRTDCIIAVSGFFCAACRKFWPEKKPALNHCSSDQHLKNYASFTSRSTFSGH